MSEHMQAQVGNTEPEDLTKAAYARLDKLGRNASIIEGRRQELLSRQAELTDRVSIAKANISVSKEIEEGLIFLQNKAHERSVGAFEKMLTAITHDVDPEAPIDISLKLEMQGKMPSLDINQVVNGKLEAITSGAVANAVSTGLRFIALARSGRSRFIVLDEPDCFMGQKAVENFFGVIEQLSQDAGMQVVLITHHDVSEFKGNFRVYRVNDAPSSDGYPRRVTELMNEGNMQPSEFQDRYFTTVECENFESFTRSQIELAPGVTVITGKHNRGKSSWSRMFQSAFLGECKDKNIRHGCSETSVAIGISDGRVLQMTRRTKGTIRGDFVMHTQDSYDFAMANPNWRKMENIPLPLQHTNGVTLPSWVPDETGVALVDKINVALWDQLTPVFMLDKPGTAQAALLSVGRESGHLYAMNSLYKKDHREDKDTEKKGEIELHQLGKILEDMSPISDVLASESSLRKGLDSILQEQAALQAMGNLIVEIDELNNEQAIVQAIKTQCSIVDAEPAVKVTEGFVMWFDRWDQAQSAIRARYDGNEIELPTLLNADEAGNLLKEIKTAHIDIGFGKDLPPKIDDPVIKEVSSIAQTLVDLDKALIDASIEKVCAVADIPSITNESQVTSLLADIGQASAEIAIPNIPNIDSPMVVNTHDLSETIASIESAKLESQVQKLSSIDAPELQDIGAVNEILDEMDRQQRLIASCKATATTNEQAMQELDMKLNAAIAVVGREWTLDEARIERIAGDLLESTSGEGSEQRGVVLVKALHEQMGALAKEGFAYGLNESIGADHASEHKKKIQP